MIPDTDLRAILTKLTRQYGDDAAQDAMVALVSAPTPPRNPKAFCARVAWCSVSHELRRRRGVKGTRSEVQFADGDPDPAPLPDRVAEGRQELGRFLRQWRSNTAKSTPLGPRVRPVP